MIDIHAHILSGVDDGADSVEKSIAILKKAEKAGFTDIILTPHFIEGQYENSKIEIKPKILELKKLAYTENVEVLLHHGNEIFLTENTPELLCNCVASTLANTRYVLFEIPFTTRMVDLEEILSKLTSLGCIPIIAHPERYLFIQEDPSYLLRLMKMGTLVQVNYGSFLGLYGKEAKKTAEYIISNRMAHFIATDAHKHEKLYDSVGKVVKKLYALTHDSKYVRQLTTYNAKCVLNDLDIDIEIPSRK